MTGGSRGVGGAIALALAGVGVDVWAVSRHGHAPGAHPRITTRAVDLGDDTAVEALAAEVLSAGGLSILVHAAGVFDTARIQEGSVDEFDRQFRLNLRAPYVLTQRLLPSLRAASGDVVFISSATVGRAGVAQYAATKFGLKAVADSLRDEVNPDGVRVMTVHLGRTATDMQRSIHEAEGRAWDAGRLIQPEDVAATVLAGMALPSSAQVSELWLLPTRKV